MSQTPALLSKKTKQRVGLLLRMDMFHIRDGALGMPGLSQYAGPTGINGSNKSDRAASAIQALRKIGLDYQQVLLWRDAGQSDEYVVLLAAAGLTPADLIGQTRPEPEALLALAALRGVNTTGTAAV